MTEESKYGASMAILQRYLTPDDSNSSNTNNSGFGDVDQNINILLAKISIKDGEKGSSSTSRRVRHLNDLAKVIRHVGPNAQFMITNARRIIENVKLALLSRVKEVRAGSLRVLRYILSSSQIYEIMLSIKIDHLVARSLDSPPQRDIERLQAMRFVRQVLLVCPSLISRSLVAPLMSIVSSDTEVPLDNITWAALATLCEIALTNINLSSHCGIIKVLVRGLLKCQSPEISETVILTLCHLLNHPSTRKHVRTHLDIEGVLAPITDLHFSFHTNDNTSSDIKSDRDKRVESAKISITALLKSWPGFLLLLNPSINGISTIINMLPLTEPYIQRQILEILYSSFHLKIPQWTDDYRIAIASVDPTQYSQDWSLEGGWVAEEGKSLLPPKVMERVDLMGCYHALLLTCLLKAGFFTSLVEVVKLPDQHIAVMTAVLMGQLLHMANSILPPEYFGLSLKLPDLIAAAMSPDEQGERNRASEVINCLDRIHQMKKQPVKPSSLYLKLTLEQAGYFSGKGRSYNNLMHNVHISNEMDDLTLQSHIRDTLVLTNPRECPSWDWNLILSLLHHPYLYTVSLTEESNCTKFLRSLTSFFKPSSRQYSSIVYSLTNSKKYSSVGLQLIKYLSKMEGIGCGLLQSLIKDIIDQLGQVTASKVTADVFSPSSVSHKMSRDYFLLIGAVSFHNSSLLYSLGAYGPILDICSIMSRHDLHKLIISSLDFSHDNYSKPILQKLLNGSDGETRLYATKHMRVFLRVNAPFFSNWGMEMLIGQLYDTEEPVREEAIDILDEACEEESFLEALVLQHPALLHLSERGVSLLTRFISVKRGYSLLSRLGHLKTELDAWLKDYNYRYVSVVEQRLAESLTSYRQTKEGEFHRRKGDAGTFKNIQTFVPVHFYSQLVRHEEGCGLLKEEGHISKLIELLQKEPNTSSDILEIKAAAWALGHIGTSVGGLDLLLGDDVIQLLVKITESSPVATIRGTCFYSLCLISKTPQGADSLLTHGWTSVRHSSDEKWPLILSEAIEDVIHIPSSPLSPSTSFNGVMSVIEEKGRSGESPKREEKRRQSSPSHTMSGRGEKRISRTVSAVSVPVSTPPRNYVLRPVRPMDLGEKDRDNSHVHDSPVRRSTPPTGRGVSLNMTRLNSLTSLRPGTTGNFVGVVLPLELSNLFKFKEDSYKGSRADYVSTDLFDDQHHFLLDTLVNHTHSTPPPSASNTNQQQTKENGVTPLVDDATHDKTEPDDKKVLGSSVHSHTSTSSGSVTFDESSYEGQLILHREFLEIVYYLCSDVSLRKNVHHLNLLCNKFPCLSQDSSLYWKTMSLLSLFHYTQTNRRLIQAKFDGLTFDEIFSTTRQYYQTHELLKDPPSSPTGHAPSTDSDTTSNRRRNSTGEILKTKPADHASLMRVGSSHSEEKLDTKSIATTTTASEMDTLSEGSLTSNEMLEWEGEGGEGGVVKEEGERVREDQIPSLAEAGNRLSQLELDVGTSSSMPPSIVEVVIDL